MAEKIILKAERYKNYNMDELTSKLSETSSKAEAGTVAAASAALACALALKAANALQASEPENERLIYIVRNTDKLRTYMSALMDQDIRCRAPMNKAIKENRPQEELDACLHPASEITEEIIGMMVVLMDFLKEMSEKVSSSVAVALKASAEAAMSAARICGVWFDYLAGLSTDETFSFVIRREYELTYKQLEEKYDAILEKVMNNG